jgi:aspartate aminotransferase-like enzyme/N-acyl-L-homoserine lactone synthetase
MNLNTKTVTYSLATVNQFDDIHRLNYRAFVEEIPQHPPNAERKLIDKFHDQNTYVVATCNGETIGMVTLRGERPFSLDSKLQQLDSHLPKAKAICELRLLYVVPEHRRSVVFYGLARVLFATAIESGYDLAIVSATLREMRLYKHLGFIAFGPEVGTENARYQPMWLDFDGLKNAVPHLVHPKDDDANFSTGPVAITREVHAAFVAPAISHRSAEFMELLSGTRKALCDLTQATSVAILCGSGTTANDVIALQIAARFGALAQGIILVNGEFGERLNNHASRAGLTADVMRQPWGDSVDLAAVEQRLSSGKYDWIWSVHCETSTGALIDLAELKHICSKNKTALYLDCMSTMGVIPIDLRGVELASASSGKGLASVAGLALVFANGTVVETPNSPSSLNLQTYLKMQATPFTLPSPLLAALATSIQAINTQRYSQIQRFMLWLRVTMNDAADEFGFKIITPVDSQTAVLTIALPAQYSSIDIGKQLQNNGIKVGFESEYLCKRNWMQFALMGAIGDDYAALRRLAYEQRSLLQRQLRGERLSHVAGA